MKALDQCLRAIVPVGIELLMRITVAAQKFLKSKSVPLSRAPDNDGAANIAFDEPDAAQDQSTHDAFAEFGFLDHEIADAPRRNNNDVDLAFRDPIHERWPPRELRKLAQNSPRPMRNDHCIGRLMRYDANAAFEDQHEAVRGRAFGDERFTRFVTMLGAKALKPINGFRFEHGKHLLTAGDGGKRLRHERPPIRQHSHVSQVSRGCQMISWQGFLCAPSDRTEP